MNRKLNIVFLHPDLGIGGAERLVVDAALALKSFGHQVRFLTSHHDLNHCFVETKDGSLDVTVVGDFLPRSIFGKGHAAFAYLRSMFTTLYLLFFASFSAPNLVFVDQISAPNFLIKIFSRLVPKIVFYCHHPDLLLCTKRDSWLKRMYRIPIDSFEQYTTGLADCVLVNSNFTAKMFRQTFKTLDHVELDILYPCVSENLVVKSETPPNSLGLKEIAPNLKPGFFLSLNRFERKKDVALAIQALAVLESHLSDRDFDNVHLVIAGGFDPINQENKDYFAELTCLTENLQLHRKVTFLKSPNDDQKVQLLAQCLALIYTPSGEHFGIVPVEAMLYSKPVIAVNDGGPLETIVDGETGLLRAADSELFSLAMRDLLRRQSDLPLSPNQMGQRGRERALRLFSFDAFAEKLNAICVSLVATTTAEEEEVAS